MRILMISRKAKQCGVADYGKRLFDILKGQMEIFYSEVENADQYYFTVSEYKPDIILYNYHYATLPFIKDEVLNRSIRHYAIFHEAGMNFTPDRIIDTSVRPLFELPWQEDETNLVPTIGSFGFGFPDKNFSRIAEVVKSQYSEAVIRLNIPFAEYGDRDGQLAKREAEKVRGQLMGTNIRLEVNHDYLSQKDLLDFLRGNDINLFLYQPSHGRGLSSAIDYALSVKRPIGVSNSEMFRHLPAELCVDNNSLDYLIKNWFEILKPVYEYHSNERLIQRYKDWLK